MSVLITSHHIDAGTRVPAIFSKLSNTLLCQVLPPSSYIHCLTEQPILDIAFKYDNFKTGVVLIAISETERCACGVGAGD
ncbi:MAG: hypothetical protein V7L22_09745 [Nostoc sp.]|uniref:hypothetical protein n=1 Tax=Nostoc sp. TaxID=1180 RepID=UPI002FFB7AD4